MDGNAPGGWLAFYRSHTDDCGRSQNERNAAAERLLRESVRAMAVLNQSSLPAQRAIYRDRLVTIVLNVGISCDAGNVKH